MAIPCSTNEKWSNDDTTNINTAVLLDVLCAPLLVILRTSYMDRISACANNHYMLYKFVACSTSMRSPQTGVETLGGGRARLVNKTTGERACDMNSTSSPFDENLRNRIFIACDRRASCILYTVVGLYKKNRGTWDKAKTNARTKNIG